MKLIALDDYEGQIGTQQWKLAKGDVVEVNDNVAFEMLRLCPSLQQVEEEVETGRKGARSTKKAGKEKATADESPAVEPSAEEKAGDGESEEEAAAAEDD